VAGAVGALVTAATPARALSGVAGLFSATQGQVDNVFYQNTVKSAIIQKMDTVRAALRQTINGYDKDEISKYSYEDLMADLTQYHQNCAFVAGIKNIPRDTDQFTPATGAQTVGQAKSTNTKPNEKPAGNAKAPAAQPAANKAPVVQPAANPKPGP
jgi:hypothetical protein